MSRHPMSASADYENMLSAVRASRASQREIAASLSTVTGLVKRIAELEGQATTERKRREECEAVLREVAGAPNRIAENARIIAAYFGEWN